MEDLRVLFFLHVVESFLLAATGLRLFGHRGRLWQYLAVGVTHGFLVWLVRGIYRTYGIPFGTHTLILGLLLIVLIRLVIKVDWNTALGASLVSLCLILLGSAFSDLVASALYLKTPDILANPWVHVLIGYIENIFLLAMLVANRVYGFTITRSLEV